jgi:hypothetical protein
MSLTAFHLKQNPVIMTLPNFLPYARATCLVLDTHNIDRNHGFGYTKTSLIKLLGSNNRIISAPKLINNVSISPRLTFTVLDV